MMYGIRITYVCWGTIDGGPDIVGTRDEIKALCAIWRAKHTAAPVGSVLCEPVPYTGDDPASRDEALSFLRREGYDGSGEE